jgi:hypothetical protein
MRELKRMQDEPGYVSEWEPTVVETHHTPESKLKAVTNRF